MKLNEKRCSFKNCHNIVQAKKLCNKHYMKKWEVRFSKQKSKDYAEKEFLCKWNFCTSCIAYRKAHKFPIPRLKRMPKPNK